MARFLESEIISLVGAAPRYDLGESLGPDIRLGELLQPSVAADDDASHDLSDLGELALGYAQRRGQPEASRSRSRGCMASAPRMSSSPSAACTRCS